VLKHVDVADVLSLTLVAGLGTFLVVPGRRQGLGRWAMGMAGAGKEGAHVSAEAKVLDQLPLF